MKTDKIYVAYGEYDRHIYLLKQVTVKTFQVVDYIKTLKPPACRPWSINGIIHSDYPGFRIESITEQKLGELLLQYMI